MEVRRIGADLPAAVHLPDLRLAAPLALFVAHHERGIDEHHGIIPSRVIRPAGCLLDAACPAGVNDLALPVDDRHACLIGQKVSVAFSPGKVNTQEANICHPNVVSHLLFDGDAAHRALDAHADVSLLELPEMASVHSAICPRWAVVCGRSSGAAGGSSARGTAPKNQCVLTTEFALDVEGGVR